MFGATLKATNSSFQKGITFCRSIYVKKGMKLLAFIFEQPSYSFSVGSDILMLYNINIYIHNHIAIKMIKHYFHLLYTKL